jgi:hypothetical protein
LPSDALAADIDVGEELIELLLASLYALGVLPTVWLGGRAVNSGRGGSHCLSEEAVPEMFDSHGKQLAKSLASENDLHI